MCCKFIKNPNGKVSDFCVKRAFYKIVVHDLTSDLNKGTGLIPEQFGAMFVTWLWENS